MSTFDCPQCGSTSWNPLEACHNCVYSLKFTLENPSDYQAKEKWPKHGLLYNGTSTIIDPSTWGKSPGSKFMEGVDLMETLQFIATSGEILIPKDTRRDESYIFYMGTTIGGGLIAGQWKEFYAVRLVKPNEADKIHIFPDDIRSMVDKEVVCGRCGRAYVVSQLPGACSCRKLFPRIF